MTPAPTETTKREPVGNDAEWNGYLLSLLLNSSLACIVTDQRQTIQQWNHGAETLLGWKAKEVLGRPVCSVLPNFAISKHNSSVSLGAGKSSLEISLQQRDGGGVRVKVDSTTLPAVRSLKAGHLFLLHDITEKKFLEEALLATSEREQRRIGQELHDHLCQHLLGAAFAAKALAGELDRDQSRHAPQLHDLARLVNDAVSQVRDISRGLHPVELDAAGLMSSLQELANRAAHSTPCVFLCEKRVLVKNSRDALNAYRIAQTVVMAALQQTGAGRIEIVLAQNGSSISLEIIDDGKAESELTSDPAGVAAKTIQYRAQAMNGALTLTFHPDKGTHVICHFPS